MKVKHIFEKFSAILSLALAVACAKDGEKIYLSGLEKSDFMVSETAVVLTQETASDIVLSLAWSSSTPVISNPDMSAPDVFAAHIQISSHEDFSSGVIETLGENGSKAYTGGELNTIAKDLGLAADVATPVYFRLRGSMGNNVESAYSDVKTVAITPYSIDMSVGFLLNTDREETGITLASPASDGVYTGFVGATAWMNFWMLEGDGTVWGNIGEDGKAFVVSSESTAWNFWYPSQAGCYYTTVDTGAGEWSAVYLPLLSVGGDITGEMTYDRAGNKWYCVFEAASAGTVTIRLSGEGDKYDRTTGDAAPAPGKVAIAFAQDAGRLALATSAGDITVDVPAAGESTLTVDLSDPYGWTCVVTGGSDRPEPVIEELFLVGIDDGFGGSWNFDNTLKLYDEDGRKYTGVVDVNSLWGYQIAIEKDNWGDVYKAGEGDALAGTLVFQAENNIPAPAPGLYFFDVSLKDLTYALTAIGSEIYVQGMDDTWNFDTPLAATATPGVYSGAISFGTLPWGLKIHPVKDAWTPFYGGADGLLALGGQAIGYDNGIAPGTYTMTVDLVNGTYTLE